MDIQLVLIYCDFLPHFLVRESRDLSLTTLTGLFTIRFSHLSLFMLRFVKVFWWLRQISCGQLQFIWLTEINIWSDAKKCTLLHGKEVSNIFGNLYALLVKLSMYILNYYPIPISFWVLCCILLTGWMSWPKWVLI